MAYTATTQTGAGAILLGEYYDKFFLDNLYRNG